MTVPLSERHDSRVLYVHTPYKIAEHMADFLDKTSRACRRMYTDEAVKYTTALKYNCKIGNSIAIVDEMSYKRREKLLAEALDALAFVSVTAESIVDGFDKGKRDRYEDLVSGLFDELESEEKMILGVMRYDDRCYARIANN